jgi:hypothetical protein
MDLSRRSQGNLRTIVIQVSTLFHQHVKRQCPNNDKKSTIWRIRTRGLAWYVRFASTPRARKGHQWIELAKLIILDTTILCWLQSSAQLQSRQHQSKQAPAPGQSPGKFLRGELSWKFVGAFLNDQENSLVFLEEQPELSPLLQKFLDWCTERFRNEQPKTSFLGS